MLLMHSLLCSMEMIAMPSLLELCLCKQNIYKLTCLYNATIEM